MPPLGQHQSSSVTKLLLIGNSGSGKSGALASLADAGYNLRIVDLDNGIDVLKNYLADPTGPYRPEALGRVEYETITDQMKTGPNGRLVPAKATVWQRTVALLENWKTPTANFGSISTWTPKDVLVIDSLTFLSNAALQFILMLNGRLGKSIEQSDWYASQQLVEGMLQMLYDSSVRCNVVVTSHITYIGEEGQAMSGYPSSLGKALPPKIGRYFNSMLMTRTTGQGSAQKRQIFTTSQGVVELKNSAPLKVKPSYSLGTGLAEYFKAVRGEAPQEAKPNPLQLAKAPETPVTDQNSAERELAAVQEALK